ncbi:MAG: BON domain-containing protein [Pseudomonadota bacterium]
MKPVLALFCAILLASAAGCGQSRSLGAAFGDMDADHSLKSHLLSDGDGDYSDIDITIFEGRLMLTGTMPDEPSRARLIQTAWQVEGVKEIIDEIIVGDDTSFGQGFADSRIDAAIRSKLITDGEIRSGDVKIAVSNGVAYLIGVARNEAALGRIVGHARTTGGVAKVVSHVVYMDEPTWSLYGGPRVDQYARARS